MQRVHEAVCGVCAGEDAQRCMGLHPGEEGNEGVSTAVLDAPAPGRRPRVLRTEHEAVDMSCTGVCIYTRKTILIRVFVCTTVSPSDWCCRGDSTCLAAGVDRIASPPVAAASYSSRPPSQAGIPWAAVRGRSG